MNITFPDGSKKAFSKGLNGLEIALSISEGLARNAVAIEVNGEINDLSAPIEHDSKIRIITFKDKEGVDVFRHSTAHILAAAIMKLYPDAKPTIGPAVEEGFYYDFDMPPISDEDLAKIEEEMKKIIESKEKFEREEITKKEALEIFKGNPYKTELIHEMEGKISIYKTGKFVDLCRGPHVPDTGKIKAVKLTKVAGAYWRGDAKNRQLQRIYGISFTDKKDLNAYLTLIEEASKRDHRKIGKDMDLIMMHEYAPGMPFFLPKGMIMLIELVNFVREYSYGEGYKEVKTPQLFNAELWNTSGHWEHFKQDMFCIHHAEDNVDMALKPMNCPAHMLVFKNDVRSYKDLPFRIAETTTLYRNEKSGTLHGLTRVRSLSQDDTHIFLTQEMILDEIKVLLDKVKRIYSLFGLQIDEINLSTRPEKFLGEKSTWDSAESSLKKALDESSLKYKINEGDGAFYGPKIDVKVKDAIGRQWQLATIQLDYQLPVRFGLLYDDVDGKRKTPVVIHRAILGTMERFMGIIIEHYAGKFPLWLNPEQVRILPIADRHTAYANTVKKELEEAGIRATIDANPLTTSKKVREAEIDHVNYIVVVGDKEIENKSVNVRTRDNKIRGEIPVAEFTVELLEEIEKKK